MVGFQLFFLRLNLFLFLLMDLILFFKDYFCGYLNDFVNIANRWHLFDYLFFNDYLLHNFNLSDHLHLFYDFNLFDNFYLLDNFNLFDNFHLFDYLYLFDYLLDNFNLFDDLYFSNNFYLLDDLNFFDHLFLNNNGIDIFFFFWFIILEWILSLLNNKNLSGHFNELKLRLLNYNYFLNLNKYLSRNLYNDLSWNLNNTKLVDGKSLFFLYSGIHFLNFKNLWDRYLDNLGNINYLLLLYEYFCRYLDHS